MNKKKLKKYIAFTFLVLMCIQYIPIEGYGVSNVKLAAMCLAPPIWFLNFKTFSRAFIVAILYIFIISISVISNIESFRFSSFVYKISFVLMFLMYYDLIHINRAISLNDFIKFIKTFIAIFAITLIFQQFFLIIGITSFPLFNLSMYLDRGIGANSLSLEPSHSARILTVLMLVLIRLYEVKYGKRYLKASFIYNENRYLILAFLWTMITMGSGTAILGLVILSFYFIQKQYLITFSFIITILFFVIPYLDYKPLNRVKATISAIQSLDKQLIIDTDDSAAGRIVPFINTFRYVDFNDNEIWLGSGIDTIKNAEYFSDVQTIGGITDYGFISFIVSIVFVLTCCIYKLRSIESIIYIFFLSMTIGNVAYVWGILMLMTTSKYFLKNSKNYQEVY